MIKQLSPEACSQGQYLDQAAGCKNCPVDEWSNGGSVGNCQSCPANKGVASGAGTSEAACTWSKLFINKHLGWASN